MITDELTKRIQHSRWWSRPWLLAGLLVLATLAAYGPAMHGGFVWDDDYYVTGNKTLLSGAGLWQIWTDPSATPQYYPLVHTTFWLEHALWGLRPLGYHLDNVLLHALVAVLLWQVLNRLAVPGAGLAAAIFALHPVHVESVAWITERKNVLSGAFYLGALLAYWRFAGVERSWKHYWLALALFLCALLSKTVTCTLPAVLVLLMWWKKGRVRWADVWPLVPMFVGGLGLGLLTAWLEKHRVGAVGPDWQLLWVERGLIAGRALWFYAGKLAWPQSLVFIYPRWQVEAGALWQWAFPAAALALIVALWLCRARIGRGPLVGVLCFAGTLFPALGFVDVYPMRFSFVADHFQYLASIALIALVLAGLARTRLATAFTVAVLPLLMVLTWQQAGQYRNLETLWETTLQRNPGCWMAHQNLSTVLLEQGRVKEAADHCEQALQLRPDNVEAHVNLGNCQLRLGRLEEVITHFQKAVQLRPSSVEAHINLGGAFLKKGVPEDAMASFRKALDLRPDLAEAHYSFGVACLQKGDAEAAMASWLKAVELQPDYVEANYNLGFVLAQQGRFEEALGYHQKAVELRPTFADARFGLGNDLLQLGRLKEAAVQFQQVLETMPNQVDALNNLALVLATCPEDSVRNGAKAIELAQRADHLEEGKNPVILHTLAAAYAESGQFDKAAETAQRAADLANALGSAPMAEAIRAERSLYQSGSALRHVR